MKILPLPKTPKIPTGDIIANRDTFSRALYETLTEIQTKMNMIIQEIDRIKKEASIPE
jgi:hypothetical protein